MNLVHRWYCASPRWRHHLDRLVPWALHGIELEGRRVVELGSGPGLTTDWLAPRCGELVAVELEARAATALARRRPDVRVIAADATAVPLEDGCADVVLSFTMLHHLPDGAAQDRLLREAHRLLRPGGVFAGSDSRPSLLFTLAHVADTCTLVPPQTFDGRLVAAGFTGPEVDAVPHAFRFRAAA